MTDQPHPKPKEALVRALRRRCPRCGQGGSFEGWFRLPPTCPRCGLKFEREDGGFLGSLVLNYSLSGALGVAVMVVWFAMTLPDTPIVPMMIGVMAVVLGSVPLFFPFSKMVWIALDLISTGPEEPTDPEA